MTDRAARWATSVVLALLVVVGAVQSSLPAVVVLPVAVLGVLACLVVGPPGPRARVAAVVVLVSVGVLCADSPSNIGWFAACVLVGWAAIDQGMLWGVVLGVVSWVTLLVGWLVVSDQPGWSAWFAGTAFTLVISAFVRRERVLTEQLRAAQAGLADRARTEERTRIAREMHDVIGHALTVSLLHVSSARLALADDPAEAEASLAEAERLARRSLDEVRAAVGVMRGVAGQATPTPGAADLDELIESFRRAGTSVTFERIGDLSRLSDTEGLTVYRILQEALTNVARHAPASPVSVRLESDAGRTRVLVDSAGTPPAAPGAGNGVSGMRERAEAVGGVLSAGPWRSGWRVEAVLPS